METSTFIVAFAMLIASLGGGIHSRYAGIPTAARNFQISVHNPDILWWLFEWIIPTPLIESNVFFYSYTRGNSDVPEQLWINSTAALASSYFDVSKQTVILLHGFSTDHKAASVQGPKKEYMKYKDVNVIIADYGNINHDPFCFFFYTAAKAIKIGRFIGKFMLFLIDQGVSPDDIHVVGHSLGGHIGGFAAKYTKKMGKTIGRVTGLDACYPVFEYNTVDYRLASDDAKFTDCIFTNYGGWGLGIPVCQANFFPNGVGMSQPGCFDADLMQGSTCGHSRVVDYFIESINPNSTFSVLECDGVPEKWHIPHCWPTNKTLMGEYANPQAKGMFYVETNSKAPYSRGRHLHKSYFS